MCRRILALMDKSQLQMLKQYATGNLSVVCIDSTHGTNAYNFYLTTLMVLDGHREGYPVAFLYSNRQTEETFILFFQAIRAKSDIINCQTFMSDLAHGFYNAWRFVMGECNNRLFCAWHVSKCFWENVTRLVKGDS